MNYINIYRFLENPGKKLAGNYKRKQSKIPGFPIPGMEGAYF